MEKTDLRKQSDEVSNHTRRQAIRFLKQGKKQVEIATLLGVHPMTIHQWSRQYQKEGRTALTVKERGVKHGQGRVLTPAQEKAIWRMIIDKMPDQIKLSFVLWTRKAIKELIYRQYGIHIAIRTIVDYLQRWNFTPQWPAKRA